MSMVPPGDVEPNIKPQGTMTMAYTIPKTDKTWQPCLRCGRKMKMLDHRRDLATFLAYRSAQRRGLRCMNCGQATCFKCSDKGFCCACMSNAWVALPYLEGETEFRIPAWHREFEKEGVRYD